MNVTGSGGSTSFRRFLRPNLHSFDGISCIDGVVDGGSGVESVWDCEGKCTREEEATVSVAEMLCVR